MAGSLLIAYYERSFPRTYPSAGGSISSKGLLISQPKLMKVWKIAGDMTWIAVNIGRSSLSASLAENKYSIISVRSSCTATAIQGVKKAGLVRSDQVPNMSTTRAFTSSKSPRAHVPFKRSTSSKQWILTALFDAPRRWGCRPF